MPMTLGELLDQPELFAAWQQHASAAMIVLHLAAEIDLFGLWDEDQIALSELAERARFDLADLRRLVAFLAAEGILEVRDDERICHTSRSRLLRHMNPLFIVSMMTARAGLSLLEALLARSTPFEAAFGMTAFDYFTTHPREGRAFGDFMTFLTSQTEQFIMSGHDFQPFRVAIDVGGSHGSLLTKLLDRHKDACGILYELPDVADRAREVLRGTDDSERIKVIGGDFFRHVPEGGDLYLLKQVLHDWDDEHCVALLKQIRKVIPSSGRLAVIDRLMPEQLAAHPAYPFDIFMLVLARGRERKLSEFEALFQRSGFIIDTVNENRERESILECIPA